MRTNYLYAFAIFIFFIVGCGTTLESNPYVQDPTAPDYLIAFNVAENIDDQNYEVFVMHPDGSHLKNLSNSPYKEWVYASDQDYLFLVSNMNACEGCFFLYQTDANAKRFVKMSEIPLADSWVDVRKNGREFIVKPMNQDSAHFLLLNKQGDTIEILAPPLDYVNDAVFSHNEKMIVFRGVEKLNDQVYPMTDELYEFSIKSKQLRKLTSYKDAGLGKGSFDYQAGPPRRMNDGRYSYASYQNGSYSIFAVDPKTLEIDQLTSDTMNQVWHDWSKDGKLLFFDGQKMNQKGQHIYVQNMETKRLRQLTFGDESLHLAPVIFKAPRMIYDDYE